MWRRAWGQLQPVPQQLVYSYSCPGFKARGGPGEKWGTQRAGFKTLVPGWSKNRPVVLVSAGQILGVWEIAQWVGRPEAQRGTSAEVSAVSVPPEIQPTQLLVP